VRLLAALLALWVALVARPALAQPPPRHLDPAYEVAAPAPWPRDDARRVRELDALLAPLVPARAMRAELIAVAALETGWFRSRACALSNFAGVKAKLDVVRRYAALHGHPMRWFRAAGHVGSGDSPTVYYAVWDSPAQFWRDWLTRHVGAAPGALPAARIYAEAGARFWRGSPRWIEALIDAGYRGRLTAGIPARRAAAIRNHHSIVRRVLRLGGTPP
jgi:hypothetical protein